MIDSFRGEWRFLSNYFWSPIRLGDGFVAMTVEHGFQSYKTEDVAERLAILNADTPGQAKKLGRTVTLRPDWDSLRLGFMLELVRAKFTQHPELAVLLLETGTQPLVEGNDWGDRYWGKVNGRGENHLGKTLMQVREELRAEE